MQIGSGNNEHTQKQLEIATKWDAILNIELKKKLETKRKNKGERKMSSKTMGKC